MYRGSALDVLALACTLCPYCSRDDMKNLEHMSFFGFPNGPHWSTVPLTWHPPPYRAHFQEWGRVWGDVVPGSRLVIISNKYENEWKKGPINFIPSDVLIEIMSMFVDAGFFVLYNRPHGLVVKDPWQVLEGVNVSAEFDDFERIAKYREQLGDRQNKVRTIQEVVEGLEPRVPFNEAQMRLYARSSCFVSVQGGNSVLASYFGGRNILYFQRGHEMEGKVYFRLYPRLSGAAVDVVKSLDDLRSAVQDMIKVNKCFT